MTVSSLNSARRERSKAGRRFEPAYPVTAGEGGRSRPPRGRLGLISSRSVNLQTGIEFTPGSLHVEFQGRKEFLTRLGAALFALENHTDRVLDFVARGVGRDETASAP